MFAAQLPQGFNLYLVYQNLVFFVAGIYFNQLNKEPASNNTLLLLSAIAFLMVQYFFHQDHVFSDRGLFSLLTALTSIYFVIQLACLINKHPLQWLLTIGTYSLSIYLIHIFSWQWNTNSFSEGFTSRKFRHPPFTRSRFWHSHSTAISKNSE